MSKLAYAPWPGSLRICRKLSNVLKEQAVNIEEKRNKQIKNSNFGRNSSLTR